MVYHHWRAVGTPSSQLALVPYNHTIVLFFARTSETVIVLAGFTMESDVEDSATIRGHVLLSLLLFFIFGLANRLSGGRTEVQKAIVLSLILPLVSSFLVAGRCGLVLQARTKYSSILPIQPISTSYRDWSHDALGANAFCDIGTAVSHTRCCLRFGSSSYYQWSSLQCSHGGSYADG